MITKATIEDIATLTKIALESKAYWGYSNDLIENWKEDLTVTSMMVEEMEVFKFIETETNTIAGFYILNTQKVENKNIELEFLFIHPNFIGRGIGKQLLHHAFFVGKKLGNKSMTLLADPNAASFYKSQGFTVIHKKESSIKGRFLPIMKVELTNIK